MDTAVILLTLLTLLPSATPADTPADPLFPLLPDCKVKNEVLRDDIPSRRIITFWNSGEKNELLDWEITYQYSKWDIGFYVNNNNIKYLDHNSVTDKIRTSTIPMDPPLPIGWVDVVVEVGTQLRVTIPGRGTVMEEDMGEDVSYFTREKITGSNVTVNCLNNPRWWDVSGGTVQVLPLGGAGARKVRIYTMRSSMPRVSVGEYHFKLWDNKDNGRGQRSRVPLSPHTSYSILVSCQDSNEQLICNMKFSHETDDLTCPRDGCYLTIYGRPQDHFQVYLEELIPHRNEDPTPVTFRDGVTVLGVIGGLLTTIKIYRKVKLNITTCWRSVMNYR